MADREKVIRGWERCKKHTCPAIDSKEYADCEYTVGLYCRQDLLINDTIALLKEQETERLEWIGTVAKLTAENELLEEQKVKEQISDAIHETAKQFRRTIVLCKDCAWYYNGLCVKSDEKDDWRFRDADWFCADAEKR